MALFSPSESPAVVVREIDLTGGVPNVQSSTGAIAGQFKWGPVGERVNIANETELVETFAAPVDSDLTQNWMSRDFLSATQFLRYSNSLVVVRTENNGIASAFTLTTRGNSTQNFTDNSPGDFTISNPKILNKANFDARESTLLAEVDSTGVAASPTGITGKLGFVARVPGVLGNSIKVSYAGLLSSTDAMDTMTDSSYNLYAHRAEFDAKPGTTKFAADKGADGDEVHYVVIDEDGLLTGTKGTVLERYDGLSILSDAKNSEGVSIYAKDVINERSEYIYLLNFDSAQVAAGAGVAAVDSKSYGLDSGSIAGKFSNEISLLDGQDGGPAGPSEFATAHDLFEDKDQVEIDFLVAPSQFSRTNLTTIVNDLVATATARKDCVVVTSPCRDDLLNETSDATRVTNTVATADTFTRSSYLIVDNNYVKIYDKFNDRFVDVAAASTVAGIMAATDINRASWFSPAGSRRGQLLGITSLNYSPTKAQRDTLYKAGINPIANIPGQGALLFGDKTFLGRVSAFDRINVRRLFLTLERAIGRAAEQILFEFNDEFTRAEFVNIVEPVLREVQGRRGITDFRVVCDDTNNTAAVIDRNEFKADIFIKPARSINYVTLSFVAVRTGVDFEEVVGTV